MNSLTEFEKAVLKATREIPKGKVGTYKEIAKTIGRPRAARAVGNALNKNPRAPKTPCHRVVKSNGEIGGYAHGAAKKTKMLRKEDVIVKSGRVVDFNRVLFKF